MKSLSVAWTVAKPRLVLSLLLRTELSCLLKAVELHLGVRIYFIQPWRGREKGVLGNGSLTGILEGRSYDPREAL